MFNPIFERCRTWPTYYLAFFPILLAAAVIVINYVQGTIGTTQDFRLVEDFQTVARIRASTNPHPYFPLIRDVVSWILLFTIAAGFLVLHSQGQKMSSCLSELSNNGAIIQRREIMNSANLDTRKTYRLNALTWVLGINRIANRNGVATAFDEYVKFVNSACQKLRFAVILVSIFLAVGMAVGLHLGETNNFFITLAPGYKPLSGEAFAPPLDWTEAAYAAWWASSTHPLGNILYLLYAFIAFYIILSFHTVGLIVLVIIVGMRHLTQASADWTNRDGYYGWLPVAKVYRTVVMAVFLESCAVTVMLVMLGIQNFWFVAVAVGLYICVTPLFVVVPQMVWAEVSDSAKKDRLDTLLHPLTNRDIDNPGTNVRTLTILAEAERCSLAEIKPLRLAAFWRRTSFTAIVFPVVLTAVQLLLA